MHTAYFIRADDSRLRRRKQTHCASTSIKTRANVALQSRYVPHYSLYLELKLTKKKLYLLSKRSVDTHDSSEFAVRIKYNMCIGSKPPKNITANSLYLVILIILALLQDNL